MINLLLQLTTNPQRKYDIIKNVLPPLKSILNCHPVTGNPFSCDCRLSWVYLLRNETKDNTLKHALEKVSCINDPTVDRRVTDQDETEHTNENVLSDDTYDYYEKGDDYIERTKASKAKKLTDIPLETLPCPRELMQTIEENYGHPVQNEIRLKAFSKVGSIAPSFISLMLVPLLL